VRRRLIEHLDEPTRLAEVLFGLIMMLTFTLGAGLAIENGREGVRELLIAGLGCNTAWGIIDAVLYLMNQASERGRRIRLHRAILQTPERATALAVIRGELDEDLAPLASEGARQQLYADVLERARSSKPRREGLGREDLLGGLATFCLVFFTALPAVVPFVLLADPFVALRTSNAILLGLMFGAGWRWAGYTGGSRLGTAFAMLLLGLVLVLVAMALGG
jgi:VIT1/CCC1 family predicted Fe2+/Mn2+ transporter